MATAGAVGARKPATLCSGVQGGDGLKTGTRPDQNCVFLAAVSAQWVGQAIQYIRILSSVHNQVAVAVICILTAAAL
ncbi:hypothetical protein D3C79_980670 [compost metagenome]